MFQFLESGSSQKPTVVLLNNGTGRYLEDSSFKELQNHYHLVMPLMRGKDEKQEAAAKAHEIEAYVQKNCHGRVYAICGFFGSWDLMKLLLTETAVISEKTVIEEEDAVPGSLILSELN